MQLRVAFPHTERNQGEESAYHWDPRPLGKYSACKIWPLELICWFESIAGCDRYFTKGKYHSWPYTAHWLICKLEVKALFHFALIYHHNILHMLL